MAERTHVSRLDRIHDPLVLGRVTLWRMTSALQETKHQPSSVRTCAASESSTDTPLKNISASVRTERRRTPAQRESEKTE